MAEKYDIKAVVSGPVCETFEYSSPRVYGLQKFHPVKKIRKNKEKMRRSAFNNFRTRTNLRNLINCNFTVENSKFLTLTFKGIYSDLSIANYEFKKFTQRLKYHYGKQVKYICAVEFQKDVDYYGRKKEHGGNVHYHLCIGLPYFDSNELSRFEKEIWGLGYTQIRRTRNIKNLGAYFAKHGTKGVEVESVKLAGRKKFFASRGLKRPKIYRNVHDVELVTRVIHSEPFFEQYIPCKNGEHIRYRQYNIKNKEIAEDLMTIRI